MALVSGTVLCLVLVQYWRLNMERVHCIESETMGIFKTSEEDRFKLKTRNNLKSLHL